MANLGQPSVADERSSSEIASPTARNDIKMDNHNESYRLIFWDSPSLLPEEIIRST